MSSSRERSALSVLPWIVSRGAGPGWFRAAHRVPLGLGRRRALPLIIQFKLSRISLGLSALEDGSVASARRGHGGSQEDRIRLDPHATLPGAAASRGPQNDADDAAYFALSARAARA